MAHSIEIREKALEYLERCKNISQVARAYGISRNTLYCWLDLKQKTGKLERRVVKARPRKIDREEPAGLYQAAVPTCTGNMAGRRKEKS